MVSDLGKAMGEFTNSGRIQFADTLSYTEIASGLAV
jgi:hypothetical protein